MLRAACLLALFTAAPLAAQTPQATGTLQGVVTDDAGEPLPGANVRLEGTTLGAAATVDGEYRIESVPVGTYTVTASFAGLGPQTRSAVAVRPCRTLGLFFSLSSSELYANWGPEKYADVGLPPLLQTDPIATRVLRGEDLVHLPTR